MKNNHLTFASRSLLPLIAGLAVMAVPSIAQTPSTTIVTFTGTGLACNAAGGLGFTALSLAQRIGAIRTNGASGQASGPINFTFDDIAVTKNIDNCSTALYTLLFKAQHIQSVQISLHNAVNAEVLRLTLSGALISSISDNESQASIPSERVTISYDKIVVLDPLTGSSATCNVSTHSCF